MNILIYFIIAVLFVVLIFWTWNNTKDFEETQNRVIFIVVGIILIAIVTLIYFAISNISRGQKFSKKIEIMQLLSPKISQNAYKSQKIC